MSDILWFLTLLIGAACLLAWLALRLRRVRRAALRRTAVGLSATLALAAALVAGVGTVGLVRIYQPRDVAVPVVVRMTGEGVVARGRHLAETVCAGCHAPDGDLPMTGGLNLSERAGLPLGTLVSPNLTPAGRWTGSSDGELFRMIRTGVGADGRATSMALFGNRHLDDDDTLALIAFLRQSPAEGAVVPPFRPSPLFALLVGLGEFAIEPAPMELGREAPERGADAAYGRYVIAYSGCGDCHGAALDGRLDGPLPPAPTLHRVGERWTEVEDFMRYARLRGRQTDSSPMSWEGLARLDDDELTALYLALVALGESSDD